MLVNPLWIPIEMERVLEGQRFTTKLRAERHAVRAAPARPAAPA